MKLCSFFYTILAFLLVFTVSGCATNRDGYETRFASCFKGGWDELPDPGGSTFLCPYEGKSTGKCRVSNSPHVMVSDISELPAKIKGEAAVYIESDKIKLSVKGYVSALANESGATKPVVFKCSLLSCELHRLYSINPGYIENYKQREKAKELQGCNSIVYTYSPSFYVKRVDIPYRGGLELRISSDVSNDIKKVNLIFDPETTCYEVPSKEDVGVDGLSVDNFCWVNNFGEIEDNIFDITSLIENFEQRPTMMKIQIFDLKHGSEIYSARLSDEFLSSIKRQDWDIKKYGRKSVVSDLRKSLYEKIKMKDYRGALGVVGEIEPLLSGSEVNDVNFYYGYLNYLDSNHVEAEKYFRMHIETGSGKLLDRSKRYLNEISN